MPDYRILVVDDELRIRKLLKDFLSKAGYIVMEAADGEEAFHIFCSDSDIDLIVLDIMMPRMDGYETLRQIRKLSSVPIVMLTAKTGETDELMGFELGVDEFIQKPFSPKILTARIGAILRRSTDTTEPVMVCGPIEVDTVARRVRSDGKEIDLSLKEYELLTYFMKNPNVALSRDRILDNVWSYDYYGDARTVDTHVKKLRAKLGAGGDAIKTIWGIGYKLETE